MIIYAAEYTINDAVKGPTRVERHYTKRNKAEKWLESMTDAAKILSVGINATVKEVEVIE